MAGSALRRDGPIGEEGRRHEAQALEDGARGGLPGRDAGVDPGETKTPSDPDALPREEGSESPTAAFGGDDELDVAGGLTGGGQRIRVQMRETDDLTASLGDDGHGPECVGIGDPVDREAILGEIGAREHEIVAGEAIDERINVVAVLGAGEPQGDLQAGLAGGGPQRGAPWVPIKRFQRGAWVGGGRDREGSL